MKTRLLPLLLLSACASLPPAPAHSFVPPAPTLPTELEVCWIEIAGVEQPAGYASAGWSRSPIWDATASAVLVRHPQGDLLIDSGTSPSLGEEAKELGFWARLRVGRTMGRLKARGSLTDQLRELGVEPSKLRAVILSHSHGDHSGGLAQLPGVPVWLPAEEARFVEESVSTRHDVVMPAHARAMKGRMVPIPFTREPFANYDESYDVYGDGSVVIVPAFGHTPGSVITFVNASPTRRFAHVGDLISVTESIERNVGKSGIMTALTDENAEQTRQQVAKLVQLHGADPALTILPAHDRTAWEAIFGPMPKSGARPSCLRAATATAP